MLDLRAQVRRLSKFLYNVTNIAVDDCKTLTRYRNRGNGSAQGARPPRMDTSPEDGEHHWASTDAQYNWFASASDLSDALADGNIHLPPGACEFVGEVWKCVVLSPTRPPAAPWWSTLLSAQHPTVTSQLPIMTAHRCRPRHTR